MMVCGFITAIWIIRRLSRHITPDPQLITNAALYSLIAGVVGSRVYYVVHYYEHFIENPLDVFAIWNGGLELLGGVILAIIVIVSFLIYHKLPIRQYIDILAIGLMAALTFGRLGCFLYGCCHGKPTDFPISVRFPYDSLAYNSQVNPDTQRDRTEPHLSIPDDYFFVDANGLRHLLPKEHLTGDQLDAVGKGGQHRCLPVHPTQLYSSFNAAMICLVLFLLFRRAQAAQKAGKPKFLTAPGSVFATMFVIYGIHRFLMEYLRDDNPYELGLPLTSAQLLSISLFVFGIFQMISYHLYQNKQLKKLPEQNNQ